MRSIRALGRDLEEQLCGKEAYRALRQLDEREAKGEPLEAIDGAALRAKLVAELASDRLYRAKACLDELERFLSGRGVSRNPAGEFEAAQAPSPRPKLKLIERLSRLEASAFDERVQARPRAQSRSRALTVYTGGSAPLTVQRGAAAKVSVARVREQGRRHLGRAAVLWRVGTSMAASLALIYFLSIADAWASRLVF